MNEILARLRKHGTLMGRYKIEGDNIFFVSTDPAVTGSIKVGDENATVSRRTDFLRIEYQEAEIFLAPKDDLSGAFTAGILSVMMKANTKVLTHEIMAALSTVMPQKAHQKN